MFRIREKRIISLEIRLRNQNEIPTKSLKVAQTRERGKRSV